jgi:predicted acetyltransferase
MDYILTKGKPEDYEDIIDFGNYVFSLDFPSLLPKLYKGHRETSHYHYVVKENNKIKAMVGSFPLGLQVGEAYLKGRGIGTVSVHRYSRGSGYMKSLMDTAVGEMKAEGCDFAVLGGQRQRYEYWGFTPCGVNLNLNFNSSNTKHYKANIEDAYKFAEYNESMKNDLEKAVDLYNLQAVHAGRDKNNFIEICNSWNNRVLFVYNSDEFIGYLCTSENGESISEMLLINPEEIDKVIVSYMRFFALKNTSIVLYMHRAKEFMKLVSFCENYSINNSANIYVINYLKVIKAFMNLKNSITPLIEGVLVIEIEENGRYKLEVKNGVVSVEETDMPYDIALSHLEASSLLFSHSSFVNLICTANPLMKSWFPLPLFYPSLDNV